MFLLFYPYFLLIMTRIYYDLKDLLRYFDFGFLLRFVLLLLGFRLFNFCYRGLTDETGMVHIAFLGDYLNYINALKWFLLHAADVVVGLFNIDTTVVGLRKLTIPGRPSLILGLPCVGLGMIFFWASFVLAHRARWKLKLLWTAGGIAAICLINCIRISMMVVALHYRWNVNRFMNHHDLFKYCAYLLILLLMWTFYRQHNTSNAAFKSLRRVTLAH